MLDTPSNRQSMIASSQQESDANTVGSVQPKTTTVSMNKPNPDDDENVDFSTTLISPHDIAQEIGTWITTPALRPHSGALIKVIPNSHSNTNTNHRSDRNVAGTLRGARFELVR